MLLHKLIKTFKKLDKDSLFIDIGGYKGKFSELIWEEYACPIIIFEPFPEYFNNIYQLLGKNSNINIFNVGLDNDTKMYPLYPHGEGTSFYKVLNDSKDKDAHVAFMADAGMVLKNFSITSVKINAEGSEYAIIESLDREGVLGTIDELLIQFHPLNEYSYDVAISKLLKTHTQEKYRKGWEMFRLK